MCTLKCFSKRDYLCLQSFNAIEEGFCSGVLRMERKRWWVHGLGILGIASSLYLIAFYQSSLGPLFFILSVLAILGFGTQTDELELPKVNYPLTEFQKQVV